MSTILWANNAASTLAGAISNVAVTANLAPGSGVLFPAPAADQYFCMTFTDAATGLQNEIVHVTNVTGDTITMVRAQEGTTGQNWSAGDIAANLITAGTLEAFAQDPLNLVINGGTTTGAAAAMLATCTPTVTALGAGMLVNFKSGYDCPGAGTLKLDGTTAKSIKKWASGALADPTANDFKNGQECQVIYDGTYFILNMVLPTTTVSNTSLVIAGGTSGGSANAQTVTCTPTLSGVSAPALICFIGGFTNTGAVTLNPDGTGAKNIYKRAPNGPIACTGGEILKGALNVVSYDGTQFELVAGTSPASGIVGGARQLTGGQLTSTTASWTANEVIVETALGGVGYKGASKTFSFNGATTGANGMDTGALPTSGNLYIYAIYNPTTDTWACLGTISGSGANIYGGANMPSGYLASCLISSLKTNGSSQFAYFYQRDRTVTFASTNALNSSSYSNNTYQSLSLSTIVPPNAVAVSGTQGSSNGSAGASAVASDSSGTGAQYCNASFNSQTIDSFNGPAIPFTDLCMITAQTIYWKQVTSSITVRIDISGYRF